MDCEERGMSWLDGITRRLPVQCGGKNHPRVAQLRYEDGSAYLLKIAKDPSTVLPEVEALQALKEAGAPVPTLIDYDKSGIIVLEYISGTPWGDCSESELLANLPKFCCGWDTMVQVWQNISSQLVRFSENRIDEDNEFVEEMTDLGRWLCGKTSYPKDAYSAWTGIVDLARSAPRRFGTLDYNPYNVLVHGKAVVFLDFESLGYDWDYRRMWQYTTKVRSNSGLCWFPVLREVCSQDVFADAHYVLFVAMAIYKRFCNIEINKEAAVKMWGNQSADHKHLRAWRNAW